MTPARFLRTWLAAVLLILAGTAGFNVVIDPYGLHGVAAPAERRPRAQTQVRMVKAWRIAEVRPNAVILGNSRVDIGLDPAHPAWPAAARPVYNLGQPGAGLFMVRRYLEHAVALHRPRLVVIGLDFQDFLDAVPPPPAPLAFERRLAVGRDGRLNAAAPRQRIADTVAATLSLDATVDAVRTVLARADQNAADMTPLGFNPLHEYRALVARQGHHALFLQKTLQYMAAWRARRALRFDGDGEAAFAELAAIIALCRRQGIDLHLFIHPYHADLLETIRLAGLWDSFENWKRALVRAAAPPGPDPDPHMVLWDFSGHYDPALEPVPPPGDTVTAMRWFWEAGHYKAALGDRIIARLFGTGAGDFGRRLTPDTIEPHLAALRAAQAAYHAARAPDAARLAALFGEPARQ
jgi:hypothetical protein